MWIYAPFPSSNSAAGAECSVGPSASPSSCSDSQAKLSVHVSSTQSQRGHSWPGWADLLRLGGNGVVPLQAAWAFINLLACLMEPVATDESAGPLFADLIGGAYEDLRRRDF